MENAVFQGFSEAKLRTMFNELTFGMANWKMPFEAVIEAHEFELANAAAIFFAGAPLTVVKALPRGYQRVSCIGYYMAVGA